MICDFKHWLLQVLVLLSIQYLPIASAQCTTSDRFYGRCIPYKRCSWVEDLRKTGERISQENINKIRANGCVGESNEIHICCKASLVLPDTQTQSRYNDEESTTNPTGMEILKSQSCGTHEGNRVAFGEEVKLGQYPWMALIKYDSPSQPFKCGGSLITNRFVLTAAHCKVGQRDQIIGVVLGEHDTATDPDCARFGRKRTCMGPAEEFGVEEVIAHRGYTHQAKENDVALIKLDRNVEFKPHIKPICLPITPQSQVYPEEYFIAGWGTTEDQTTSTKLLQVKVQHKDLSFCGETFRNARLTDKHLCAAGEDKKDSCKGDSGGPLFFLVPYEKDSRFVQFGVVSFGVKSCGTGSFPGIYTNLKALIPWITNKIA